MGPVHYDVKRRLIPSRNWSNTPILHLIFPGFLTQLKKKKKKLIVLFFPSTFSFIHLLIHSV